MKIIIGHSNSDLDCLGSLALARLIYPDHRAVGSGMVHPAARNLHNLYRDYLDLLPPAELAGAAIESLVVVDTRARDRVKEFLDPVASLPESVTVYDHHASDTCDIPGATVRFRAVGANTTLLGLEVVERSLAVSKETATIALTGIYADTGNFLHETVRPEDLAVASYLLEQGASLELARTFLQLLREEHQMTLLHDLLNRLDYTTHRGHRLLVAALEVERQSPGLAAVAEKVFEIEAPDALFAVFHFRREASVLIVARSQAHGPNLPALLGPLGAGGHAQAVSAVLKQTTLEEARARLDAVIAQTLGPARSAGLIMTRDPATVRDDWSLIDASLHLERVSHTGAPVVDAAGKLVGMLTLRDISKGRKAAQMKSPVRSYMSRKLVTGTEGTSLREIEALFYKNNIGHLPIVEGDRLVGLVTRADYLRALGGGER